MHRVSACLPSAPIAGSLDGDDAACAPQLVLCVLDFLVDVHRLVDLAEILHAYIAVRVVVAVVSPAFCIDAPAAATTEPNCLE